MTKSHICALKKWHVESTDFHESFFPLSVGVDIMLLFLFYQNCNHFLCMLYHVTVHQSISMAFAD